MPTVIDSFVVTLGLDPKGFTKGQQEYLAKLRQMEEETAKRGKNVEEGARRQSQVVSKLRNEALGLLAAFAGAHGIKEFISNIVTGDAATGRFARTIGESVKSVAQWENAARLLGGSAQEIAGTMLGLKDKVQGFLAGEGGNIVALYEAISREGGKLVTIFQPFNTQMINLADNLQKIDQRTAGRGGYFGRLLGIDAATLSGMLKGGDFMAKMLADAEALGHATKEDTDRAEDLLNKWRSISILVQNAGRKAMGGIVDKGTDNALSVMKKSAQPGELSIFQRLGMTMLFPFLAPWLMSSDENMPGKGITSMKPLPTGPLSMKPGGPPAAAPATDPNALPMKPGSGSLTSATRALSGFLSGIPGIQRITAAKDAHHRTGAHAEGRALDVTIDDPSKSAETVAAIKAGLESMGIKGAYVADEYKTKSRGWTAAHIHVALPPGASMGQQTAGGAPGGDTITINGPINVSTQATDAAGFAADLKGALKAEGQRRLRAQPANAGQY